MGMLRWMIYIYCKCSSWMMPYNLYRYHRVKLAATSPCSCFQTGLSSFTVGCVYVFVCVITRVASTAFHVHFDPSLFRVHRAYGVAACLTHSRLNTLLYSLTSRWVFLWITFGFKQIQKHEHGCAHRHTLQSTTESLSSYLQPWCVFSNFLTFKCKDSFWRHFAQTHWLLQRWVGTVEVSSTTMQIHPTPRKVHIYHGFI